MQLIFFPHETSKPTHFSLRVPIRIILKPRYRTQRCLKINLVRQVMVYRESYVKLDFSIKCICLCVLCHPAVSAHVSTFNSFNKPVAYGVLL